MGRRVVGAGGAAGEEHKGEQDFAHGWEIARDPKDGGISLSPAFDKFSNKSLPGRLVRGIVLVMLYKGARAWGDRASLSENGLAPGRVSRGLACRLRLGDPLAKSAKGTWRFFLARITRNPLKRAELDEGIQENPRKSKPVFLVRLGLALIRLGGI